ncbi:MAG TPA: phosphatase PAP2-related protein [Verrucomicrobiae bacterium]|nr:phosphatase PAP2-related protein [Verrucomicrobiae bacterium]
MTPVFGSLHWSAIGLRAGVVGGALIAWFWTQSLIGRKSTPTSGTGDVIHNLTAPWHGYLATHPGAANAALITSSLFIDLFGLSLIGTAIFGSSFAPFLAILVVFGLRQICQGLCSLPPPPGIIWRSPGFPALLVTYGVGNDFFFSGHTALAVLGALEAAYLGPPWLAVIAGIIAFGEMLVVLVLRAHYTLDVVTGAFAAFLAAELARRLAPFVDGWLK